MGHKEFNPLSPAHETNKLSGVFRKFSPSKQVAKNSLSMLIVNAYKGTMNCFPENMTSSSLKCFYNNTSIYHGSELG